MNENKIDGSKIFSIDYDDELFAEDLEEQKVSKQGKIVAPKP